MIWIEGLIMIIIIIIIITIKIIIVIKTIIIIDIAYKGKQLLFHTLQSLPYSITIKLEIMSGK